MLAGVTRVRGLDHLDPTAVPLPNGTEVTTRVDRLVDGRRVPQGAVGRVTHSDGEQVGVTIAGVGRANYRRDELTPRTPGQIAFAMRREATWNALAPCIVLETVVGSHAWGLADASSDTDRRGAFVAPLPWTSGLAPPPGELVSLDGSTTYWEVGKLVGQALRADPNTLETLFVDGATAHDAMGQWLLDERECFVSQAIYGSFARYALSQIAKLRRSLRLAQHQNIVLGWLRDDASLTLDAVASRLVAAEAVEAPTPADAHLVAKHWVKQLYHSLHDRGLVASADLAGLVGFATAGGELGEVARELRPKNAYNLLRLLGTAIAWLRSGTPTFRVDEPLRSRLLAIKRGEVDLGDVLDDADALAPQLEAARRETRLPRRPDLQRADALLRRIRGEAARRSVFALPGPFGVDAPHVPEAEWTES